MQQIYKPSLLQFNISHLFYFSSLKFPNISSYFGAWNLINVLEDEICMFELHMCHI